MLLFIKDNKSFKGFPTLSSETENLYGPNTLPPSSIMFLLCCIYLSNSDLAFCTVDFAISFILDDVSNNLLVIASCPEILLIPRPSLVKEKPFLAL